MPTVTLSVETLVTFEWKNNGRGGRSYALTVRVRLGDTARQHVVAHLVPDSHHTHHTNGSYCVLWGPKLETDSPIGKLDDSHFYDTAELAARAVHEVLGVRLPFNPTQEANGR